MNKRNFNLKNHLMRIAILLFLVCIGMVSHSPRITQAKAYYSSAKQVKREIKKINKKLPKASREYKKANSQYKALYNRDKSETAGSHLMLLAKIVNSNPFIVRYGNSYYHVLNPSNGTTLLGSYTASFRMSGGTYTFDNHSCTNVTAVKSSVDAKLTSARKNLQKKQKAYKSLTQKKKRLKKSLTYRVPRKNCTMRAGETFSLEYFCDDSYYNKVTWKSSNTSILTIKKGKVKGLRSGKVTITAKTSVSKKTTKISVTVKNSKKLPLENSYMTIAVGKKAELWVADENRYLIKKAYSSNSNVVSVQKNGGNYVTLKAESVGTAVITAISEDNEVGTCTVEVFEPTFKTDLISPQVINAESLPVTYTVSFQSNLAKSDIQWPSGNGNSEVVVNYDKSTSDASLVNGTITFTFNEYTSDTVSYEYSVSYNYATICSLEFVVQQVPATGIDPANPSIDSDKDEDDVVALTSLIAEHRGRGADISEDLDDDCYTWEDGRLTGIDWGSCDLSGTLDVSACTALCSLNCYGNQLTRLEVSDNVNLIRLYCDSNQLSSLDVTNNVNLTDLRCQGNQITNLDVSACHSLLYLYCQENLLTSIDLSENPNLEIFHAGNDITVIYPDFSIPDGADDQDVTALKNLIIEQRNEGTFLCHNLSSDDYKWEDSRLSELYFYGIGLKTLDVSEFTELTYLNCGFNSLTSLDVSKNMKLTTLVCSGNQLTDLDVSANVNLTELYCNNNQLTDLDLSANVNLLHVTCDEGVSVTGYNGEIIYY